MSSPRHNSNSFSMSLLVSFFTCLHLPSFSFLNLSSSSLSLSLSYKHTHTLSLSLLQTHTHTLSLSLTNTHTHSLSLSSHHTHTLSLSLSLSLTNTHSLFLSFLILSPLSPAASSLHQVLQDLYPFQSFQPMARLPPSLDFKICPIYSTLADLADLPCFIPPGANTVKLFTIVINT
jgi:hypothetical protein